MSPAWAPPATAASTHHILVVNIQGAALRWRLLLLTLLSVEKRRQTLQSVAEWRDEAREKQQIGKDDHPWRSFS